MTAINAAMPSLNIFKIMSWVNETSEPITLTNDNGKNAVIISEDDWNSIQETLYLNSIPGMTQSLINGKNTPFEKCVDEKDVEW